MQYVDKQQLSEVENVIYQNLKDLKTENSSLNKKIKELKAMYLQYAEEERIEEQIQFNDPNRFNTNKIDSSLFQNYVSLKKKVIDKTNKAIIINNMYHKILEIVNELQGETDIKYAIYFEVKGHTYRSFMGDIPTKFLKLNTTKSSAKYEMQIYAAKFKDWATKQTKNGQMKNTMDITAHYNTFVKTLQDTYNGKSQIPNYIINKGHIAEAFERHLQQVHGALTETNGQEIGNAYDWTVDDAWRLIRISKGNDPWYTGGDVNNIQVKSLFAGDRTITSFSTIEDMFNFLTYLEKGAFDDEALKRQAKEAFNVFYNNVNQELNQALEMTKDEIIEEFVRMEKT